MCVCVCARPYLVLSCLCGGEKEIVRSVLWQVAGMMLDIGYTVEKSYLQVPRCARSSEFGNLVFPLKLPENIADISDRARPLRGDGCLTEV